MSALARLFISVVVVFTTGILPHAQKPYTILPASQARETTALCSRASFVKIDGAWLPGDTDIKAAESRLGQLSQGHPMGQAVTSPADFFRQYVGVVISGRKLIYLNAFAYEEPDWTTRFVSVCDGGDSFWGALYDPATGKFSDLHKNGVA